MISLEEFEDRIENDGVVVFPSVVDEPMLERLRKDVATAYDINRKMQKENGVDYPGVAHHMIKSMWRGYSFADYLENLPLREYISVYFGGPYILNAFSGLLNYPDARAEYQNRPHRDVRTYFPVRLSLNMLTFLDDFTEDNGSTLYITGSHLKKEMPSNEEFHARAEKMLGPAGSIALFNSNLVHSGGRNLTDKVRRCIGFPLIRPFMKQACDYTTLVTDSDSDWMKQILGYNSRPAKDLNEFYQPVGKRTYRMGQG
ncbi:MAG: hypothetical protein QOJ45_1321 [Verrucomicrobiota bacterium]|jgi:hypothetical protein